MSTEENLILWPLETSTEENQILWRMKGENNIYTYTPARFRHHEMMLSGWDVVAEGDWEFLIGVKKILVREAAYDKEQRTHRE